MDVRHEEFITLIKDNHGKNVEKEKIRDLYDDWASTYDKVRKFYFGRVHVNSMVLNYNVLEVEFCVYLAILYVGVRIQFILFIIRVKC